MGTLEDIKEVSFAWHAQNPEAMAILQLWYGSVCVLSCYIASLLLIQIHKGQSLFFC